MLSCAGSIYNAINASHEISMYSKYVCPVIDLEIATASYSKSNTSS